MHQYLDPWTSTLQSTDSEDRLPTHQHFPIVLPMHRFRKLFQLFTLAVLLSVIPFIVLGQSFEGEIESWFHRTWSQTQLFWLIIGLLAAEIFIPIPSNAVSTCALAILRFFPATLASWLGLTLGSHLSFGIARFAGPPLVRPMTFADHLAFLRQLNQQLSIWTIILTRPLPILAEATILLVGSMIFPLGLTWLVRKRLKQQFQDITPAES